MNQLLEKVLAAYGGVERWHSISSIRASGHVSGLLPRRFPGTKLANVTFGIHTAAQRTMIGGFPQDGKQAVFEDGEVRIQTDDGEPVASRSNPRAAFFGLQGIRRNFRWDPLDTAYFAGYASWNYLTAPFLLTGDSVQVSEGKPWTEDGETWHRLHAEFPAGFHTHSAYQTFYIDSGGLIRRHDFVAETVGRWASAALYCDDHRQVDGLTFAHQRCILPRGPGNRSLPKPTLLTLTFDTIEVA